MKTEWKDAVREVAKTSVLSLPVALVLFLAVHPERTGFASRWDGTCGGWTKSCAALHMTADIASWWAFVAIAAAIAKWHPVMNRVRSATTTVALIALIFGSCGGVHLLDAWSAMWPAYWHTGIFKAVASAIGVVGAVFITHDLRVARHLVERDHKELRRLRDEAGK